MSTNTSMLNLELPVVRLYDILNGIDLCSSIVGNFGFSYALGRNKKILMAELKTIEEMNKADEDYETYVRERQELIEKELAKKKGDQVEYEEVQTPNGPTKTPFFKDPELAEKKLNALAKKHDAAIEKRKDLNRKYIKFVNNDKVKIDLYQIKKEHLPEDKLTPAMVYGIVELIEE